MYSASEGVASPTSSYSATILISNLFSSTNLSGRPTKLRNALTICSPQESSYFSVRYNLVSKSATFFLRLPMKVLVVSSSPSSPPPPSSSSSPLRWLSALPSTIISSLLHSVHSASFSASEEAMVTISIGTSSGCPFGP